MTYGLSCFSSTAVDTIDVYLAEPLEHINPALSLSVARYDMAAASTVRYVLFAGG